MSNISIENVNIGSVIFGNAQHRDSILKLPAPVSPATETTYKSGTILKTVGGKLEVYSLGDNAPLSVLTYDVTGPEGQIPVRAMVSGEVRKELLIIHDDGDASNVDDSLINQLRDFSIVAIDVQELNIPDNQ